MEQPRCMSFYKVGWFGEKKIYIWPKGQSVNCYDILHLLSLPLTDLNEIQVLICKRNIICERHMSTPAV